MKKKKKCMHDNVRNYTCRHDLTMKRLMKLAKLAKIEWSNKYTFYRTQSTVMWSPLQA